MGKPSHILLTRNNDHPQKSNQPIYKGSLQKQTKKNDNNLRTAFDVETLFDQKWGCLEMGYTPHENGQFIEDFLMVDPWISVGFTYCFNM